MPPPRGLPRARGDGRPGHGGRRRAATSTCTSRSRSRRCPATARSSACVLFHSEDEAHEIEVEVDAILLQLGFKTALGPLKDWGFEIDKGAIVVDQVMKTILERVWACGDITTFDGKLKLIATGFAESAIAVAQAVHDDPARDEDPAEVLDEHRRPRRRRRPAVSRSGRGRDPVATCAPPTRCCGRLIDDVGGATASATPRRPPAGPLRGARALDRRPAALDQGGARDLRPADRPLRRPPADAGGGARRRPRGAARRGRPLAREGALPALAGRARARRLARARRASTRCPTTR